MPPLMKEQLQAMAYRPYGPHVLLPNLKTLILLDEEATISGLCLLHPSIHHITFTLTGFPKNPLSSSFLSSFPSLPHIISITVLLESEEWWLVWQPLISKLGSTLTVLSWAPVDI
jgi:hypothetical protein